MQKNEIYDSGTFTYLMMCAIESKRDIVVGRHKYCSRNLMKFGYFEIFITNKVAMKEL